MPQIPFQTRMWDRFQSHKRDVFFACVAACALCLTARAEMMRHGVWRPEPPIETHPKVSRQFGHKKDGLST
ncbi:unnamed protein product [Phytomonas sp. Hart1]|nr:unnamed protein product [Phytomonas sp. Hart1]|eukprot:CCW67889.1 unnamed protein product [Phytomonas sp. isolate Hart1]